MSHSKDNSDFNDDDDDHCYDDDLTGYIVPDNPDDALARIRDQGRKARSAFEQVAVVIEHAGVLHGKNSGFSRVIKSELHLALEAYGAYVAKLHAAARRLH